MTGDQKGITQSIIPEESKQDIPSTPSCFRICMIALTTDLYLCVAACCLVSLFAVSRSRQRSAVAVAAAPVVTVSMALAVRETGPGQGRVGVLRARRQNQHLPNGTLRRSDRQLTRSLTHNNTRVANPAAARKHPQSYRTHDRIRAARSYELTCRTEEKQVPVRQRGPRDRLGFIPQ
jgi:hypothetical protein